VDCRTLPPSLAEPAATFTTLTIDEKLRGCCGTLEAAVPLAEDVARSAFQAALHDSRFEPVREKELDDIRLELSVLTPLTAIGVASEQELLEQLTPGTDGLVIVANSRRATFLPKVWEMMPDPGSFLAALKSKCGLAEDYWSAQLAFFKYQTISFAE
jgi:AmmeMemoRadiSam system protein A